jgi:hypothetical protein
MYATKEHTVSIPAPSGFTVAQGAILATNPQVTLPWWREA